MIEDTMMQDNEKNDISEGEDFEVSQLVVDVFNAPVPTEAALIFAMLCHIK